MRLAPPPSRVRGSDLLSVSSQGLRTRKLRAALSALGITIGIASLVAVLGLSESSRSALLAQLDRLGTNLIQVAATEGIGRGPGELLDTSAEMVGRIDGVEQVSAVATLDSNVFRTDLVPSTRTGGLSVRAVDADLLDTLKSQVAEGRFMDAATARYPVTVLGAVAAGRLGITSLESDPKVWIGGRWFQVLGILEPFDLSPDLDRAALVGFGAASDHLGQEPPPSVLYVRVDPARIGAVLDVIAAQANPQNPDQVQASRPSDVLAARDAADTAFTSLFLGLGAVALLVGGVGIANVMVIAVLERRGEIGLRRALGATRRHVAAQFLGESVLLAATGGVAGLGVGSAITAGYASLRGWDVLIPPIALAGGLASALVIGAVAGLYPAIRAARLAPTDALRTG